MDPITYKCEPLPSYIVWGSGFAFLLASEVKKKSRYACITAASIKGSRAGSGIPPVFFAGQNFFWTKTPSKSPKEEMVSPCNQKGLNPDSSHSGINFLAIFLTEIIQPKTSQLQKFIGGFGCGNDGNHTALW